MNFVKRHALQKLKFSGEAGRVNAPTVARDVINFCRRLEQYELSCIFNVDKNELFYNLFSCQTYIWIHGET